MPCYAFLAALRLLIALPLLTASALLLAPHALNDDSNGVALPSGVFCGPLIFPILCKNAARRGLSPDFTGAPIRCIPSTAVASVGRQENSASHRPTQH